MGTFNEPSIRLHYAGYSPYSESSTVYRCVFKTKEARLILQSGIYIFWPIFRKARPSFFRVKKEGRAFRSIGQIIYIPDCKISLASFVLYFHLLLIRSFIRIRSFFFCGLVLASKIECVFKAAFPCFFGFWNLVENLLSTATFPLCSHVDSVNWIFVLIFNRINWLGLHYDM